MTQHIHGTIITHYGVAANNRGENEGNVTTLQKILWKGLTHTTVSAEAIRYAIRLHWQHKFEETSDPLYEVNRVWREDSGDFEIQNQAFSAERYADDDAMGYMDAKAAKEENGNSDKKGGKVTGGSATTRRGPLEVTRAVSLTPFNGETTFNARGGKKGSTSLYATEVHATSYQYSFSLTPDALKKAERAIGVIDAVCSLSSVGGNQGRFLFDFSPALCIFRVTEDPAPRVLYAGKAPSEGQDVSLALLVKRIQSGDIDAAELYVGGELLSAEEKSQLSALGAFAAFGSRQAANRALEALHI